LLLVVDESVYEYSHYIIIYLHATIDYEQSLPKHLLVPPAEVSELVWLPLHAVAHAVDHRQVDEPRLARVPSLRVPTTTTTVDDCDKCQQSVVCGEHLCESSVEYIDLTGDEHLGGINEGIVIGTKKLLHLWSSSAAAAASITVAHETNERQ
jgi:hypothetical protein